MNKKFLLIGIGLLILIALVFILGLRFSSNSHTVTKSLLDFASSNESPQKCILNNDANYGGEVYVAKGQVKADIRQAGKVSHLIFTTSSATQWSDDSKAGLQITPGEVDVVDLSRKFSFICQTAVIDEKTFIPPADNLYYPSKKVLNDYTLQNKKPECQVCNDLQGDALATCKKQLNCP